MSKYIVTAATKLSITAIELAQPILDKVKTVFARANIDGLWESDTKARKVLVRYEHLLSESEKIALAEAYLDMAKYAWRKNDNKDFFSLASDFEGTHGVTLADTRATINPWVRTIRRLAQAEIRANREAPKTEETSEEPKITETVQAPEVPELEVTQATEEVVEAEAPVEEVKVKKGSKKARKS
jgi:hypothetical protein